MMDIREEASLRAFLTSLDGLRAAAEAEFELRGPFPSKSIAMILERTRRMLDNFHGVNVVLAKRSGASASPYLYSNGNGNSHSSSNDGNNTGNEDGQGTTVDGAGQLLMGPDTLVTPGEMAVLRATATERAQLSARISHLFGVLASCVRIELSLHGDNVLPDIEHSRDRLLARVFDFRRLDGGRTAGDIDFEMIYAYVLATGQLAKDISAIIKELETLYGTFEEENFRFH